MHITLYIEIFIEINIDLSNEIKVNIEFVFLDLFSAFILYIQGTAGPDPSTVYVDMKSLRHDR